MMVRPALIERFRPWRGGGWIVAAGLALTAVLVAGAPGLPAPRPALAAASADGLLIVDCLLPGKVRRLGTRTTYVTARKAVKTTASECEIRGGEYTAYDRANYATALKIWLPLAQEGDAQAQNNVGEIYEKGLGVEPQYDLAAEWYRKAAEQGLSRAQLNLGALYEKGLGVPQDQAKALEWFRRASGLEAAGVSYVPAAVQEELQSLRSERDALRAERDALRGELGQVRRELEDARGRLQQRSGELEGLQRRLDAARADLERQRRRAEAAGDTARVQQLEQELTAKRREASEADAALDRLRAEVARLDARSERLSGELSAEQAGAAAARAEAADAKARLDRLSDQLMETERELLRQRRLTTLSREEIDGIRAELQREQGAAKRDDARIAELQKQLQAREGELEQQRARAGELSGRVATLEEQSAALRRDAEAAAAAREKAAAAGPQIAILDPQLQQTRGATGLPTARVRAIGERLIVGKVEAPAGLVALLVNDREQQASADGLFRANVPVQYPQTKVTVVAIDAAGKRASYEFALMPEGEARTARATGGEADRIILPPGLDFGNFHALVIGNNAYTELPPLKTAVGDARAVAGLLKERYGFRTRLLENADRYAILSALNGLRETLTEKDNLLIYYAGHGELDRINNRGHWLPVDAEPNSTANWISNIQITDVLNAMAARQVMIVADSCYSGTLTRAAVAQLDSGMSAEARRNWLKVMAEKRSRVVLSSGGVQPVLDSGGGEHSVFAQAFLTALTGNSDVLEGQRLFRVISERVASSAAAATVDQIPQYAPIKFAGHEAGDFFFVPTN